MNTHRQQSGMMLLEVMIGMLLFVIGIVGVMGLQAVSMKNTVDAKYRTEASYLANQIMGRMWASNAADLANYAIPAQTACPTTPTNDKERWICTVKAVLPNATGANAPTIDVTNVTTISADVTVTIQWQKDANESLHNYVVTTHISQN